jgi:hypothetical protein
MCFTDEDDFNDTLRNYAFMGRYYGGKFGEKRLVSELLKDGPYPAKQKDHKDRSKVLLSDAAIAYLRSAGMPEPLLAKVCKLKEDDPVGRGEFLQKLGQILDKKEVERYRDPILAAARLAEDWKWIRLAPLSYTLAIGDAIDPDDPPEKWRKEEAAKLAEAMARAADHARQFGSLASGEFMLLSTGVLHACLVKDWKEFEEVLKEVKKRNFARLTASVAETFGRSARFLTPDEFAAQYKVFSKYVETRAPYFNVVYEAYRTQAYEQSRRAARLAVQRWPDDENMKREVKFLDELIANRKKEKAPGQQ